jgi:BlaI family transcriptional regulator, penicillinase repressor
MSRPPSRGLTPLELEIMKVLWREGPCSVAAVQARLGRRRKLAYNTVQTMLNVLCRKGRARRQREDRAFVYSAAITRMQAIRETVGDLVQRLFDGSPEELVMTLIQTRQLTPEKVERLVALIDRRKGGASDEL